MSTRPQRGRAVRTQRGSFPVFPVVLGVVCVIGLAAILYLVLTSSNQEPTTGQTTAPVNTADLPPSVITAGSLENFPTEGSADAPVTVVEYADYQCPGCAAFATQVKANIKRDYIDTGKVRLVFHEFPLTNIHPNAVVAAEAARCAGDQDAYWRMHDMLFTNQQQWSSQSDPKAQFGVYARQLGIDGASFDSCVADGKYRNTVLTAEQAANQAGVSSTPTFMIGTQRYDTASLREGIDAALAAAE